MPSLKPSSYDRLKQTYLKQIKNTSVGRSQLGTLTSLGIQALINSYTTTLSYSTLKKVYDLLNNCYRYAVATRNIGYNPVDGVQLPKQENMSNKGDCNSTRCRCRTLRSCSIYVLQNRAAKILVRPCLCPYSQYGTAFRRSTCPDMG